MIASSSLLSPRLQRSSFGLALCGLILGFWWFGVFNVSAQTAGGTGEIRGRVINKATGEYLRNAVVKVEGTNLSTVAESGGQFSLQGLPAGVVTITTTYAGLNPVTQTVTVVAGKAISHDIELVLGGDDSPVKMNEFVVAVEREGNAKAIQDQRQANNMKKVIATDVFGDVSEGNVGEFLKLMPGVAIDYTEADVRQIRIRGMDPKYAAVTMDGAPVASAGSSDLGVGRGFEFEQLSISSIETVEISKTPTADVSASAVAGVVNLRSKGAFDRKGRHYTVNVYATENEYYPNLGKKVFFDNGKRRQITPGGSISFSDILFNNHLGVVAGFSYSNALTAQKAQVVGYRFNNNIEDNATEVPRFNNFNYRDGPKYTVRKNYNIRLDYKFTDDFSIWGRVDYNIYDATFHNRDLFVGMTNNDDTASSINRLINAPGSTAVLTGVDYSMMSQTTLNGAISTGSGGSNRKFGATTTLTLGGDYRYRSLRTNYLFTHSVATNHYRDLPEGFFNTVGATAAAPIAFRWNRPDPSSTAVTITQLSGADYRDTSLDYVDRATNTDGTANTGWPFNSFKRDSKDEKTFGGLNFRLPITLMHLPVDLKWGLAVNDEVRTNARNQQRWRFLGPDGIRGTDDDRAGLYLENVPMNFDMGGNVDGIFNADRFKLAQAFAAHPSWFLEDTAFALTTKLQNDIKLKERIDAVYLQTTFKVGPRLTIAPGVRAERTDDWSRAFDDIGDKATRAALGLPAAGTINTGDPAYLITRYGTKAQGRTTYSDVFKFLHITYRFTENLIFRASYHESITRPDPVNFVGSTTINNENAVPPTATVGNPQLKPEHSRSINLATEYYFKQVGLFGFTVFRTEVHDVQLRKSVDLGPDGFEGDIAFAGWRVTTTFNAGDTRRTGYELDYTQLLKFLPKPINNIRVFANFTHVHFDNDADALKQSRKNANGGFDAKFGRFRGNVRATWAGTRVDTISSLTGANAGRREYVDDRLMFDCGFDFTLTKTTKLFVNGRNITNAPLRTYVIRPELPLRTAKFGATWSAGLRSDF